MQDFSNAFIYHLGFIQAIHVCCFIFYIRTGWLPQRQITNITPIIQSPICLWTFHSIVDTDWMLRTCAGYISFTIFQLLFHKSIHSSSYGYWLTVAQRDLRYHQVIQQSIHVVLYKVFIRALFHSSDINSWALAGSYTNDYRHNHMILIHSFMVVIFYKVFIHAWFRHKVMSISWQLFMDIGCVIHSRCRYHLVVQQSMRGPFHSFVHIRCILHTLLFQRHPDCPTIDLQIVLFMWQISHEKNNFIYEYVSSGLRT